MQHSSFFKQKTIHIVAFRKTDRGIGFENKLLYRLPSDMQMFREYTRGHIVLMGRKTFESIGKALPNRINVVVSTTMVKQPADCILFRNIRAALCWCKNIHFMRDLYIIGGQELYKQIQPEFVLASEISDEHDSTACKPTDAFYPCNLGQYKRKILKENVQDIDQLSEKAVTYDFVLYYNRHV
jgi:dihydrofolate reductase